MITPKDVRTLRADTSLKEAAQMERRWPQNATELELARAWAAGAEQCEAPDKWHCYNRARYWYRGAEERAGKCVASAQSGPAGSDDQQQQKDIELAEEQIAMERKAERQDERDAAVR